MLPRPIAFHLLSLKLNSGKNWWSIVVIMTILIVLFYLLPWAVLCRTSKLLFANIFLVITILMKWQKMDWFGWLGIDTLVKFVFVSLLLLLSMVSFIIQKTFKIQGKSQNSLAFTNINMCPAPKDCSGDHNNHPALQALTMDVLIATIRLCPKMQKLFSLEKSPINMLPTLSCNDYRRKD